MSEANRSQEAEEFVRVHADHARGVLFDNQRQLYGLASSVLAFVAEGDGQDDLYPRFMAWMRSKAPDDPLRIPQASLMWAAQVFGLIGCAQELEVEDAVREGGHPDDRA